MNARMNSLLLLLPLLGGCISSPRHHASAFPTVSVMHVHAQALLANAMRYAAPENRLFDAASGFPVEGWNQDPAQGLHLRAFTQLTAIGEWVELLAVVASGKATPPEITEQRAREQLRLVIRTLRRNQASPRLSDRGLLVNFLAFMPDHQDGPLAGDVSLHQFTGAFGDAKGRAIWDALARQQWLELRSQGKEATIRRGIHYGSGQFKGALAPYNNDADRSAILGILDQRVVTIIFGDNANLSASIGKAIGMLLHPDVRSDPELQETRREMEAFLEAQRPGYEHLYDRETGRFFFGWDATRGQWVGWDGNPARNDYFINEFRGPTLFVILRYGFPATILSNMGTIVRPFPARDGTLRSFPMAWDGSAFQILGLGVMLDELHDPSWSALLRNAVTVMIDFSLENRLPGLLSESYTGNGVQYTGRVGIPDMAVNSGGRIVTAPSLYPLGAAYQLDPERVEAFLKLNWQVITNQLLTEHGPWEGLDTTTCQPIRFQTAAHTLALALGLLGTGPEAMQRYLDSKELSPRLRGWREPGHAIEMLAPACQVFAWTAHGAIATSRTATGFRVRGEHLEQPGIAIMPEAGKTLDLSNGRLTLRYTSARDITDATLQFKPADGAPPILNQVRMGMKRTTGKGAQLTLILPSSPGLKKIKEVVLTWGHPGLPSTEDLTLDSLRFDPL